MTKLLTEAFKEASRLPEDLQDQLAQELMQEIAWEGCWDKSLSASQDKLGQLAEKALREYKTGKTSTSFEIKDRLW